MGSWVAGQGGTSGVGSWVAGQGGRTGAGQGWLARKTGRLVSNLAGWMES